MKVQLKNKKKENDDDDALFLDKRPLNIPYINIYMLLDMKEVSVSKNKITDHIIENLPADNDRYYIKHEEGSNMFKVLEDPQ